MSVTRDPEYPAEMAQLMQSFSRCADGFSGSVVLNASLQMLSASIGFIAKSSSFDERDIEKYTDHIAECLMASVKENFSRQARPNDVEVKLS